eukprot:g3030.t1
MTSSGMVKTEEVLCDVNARFELYAASYFHPRPRGLVVFAHSLQECTGQYENLVNALWQAQFSVYLFNWRRQQRFPEDNAPMLYVANLQELLQDLKLTVEQARCREDNRKVFLIGHDVGAAVAALYCCTSAAVSEDQLAGLVLFSPAMKPPLANYCVGSVAPLLSAFWPKLRTTVERKGTLEEFYIRTFRCCANLARELSSKRKDIKLPLLILYGTGDSSEEVESSQCLYNEAMSVDKKIVSFEGRSDDLWVDVENSPDAISVLINWLRDRTNE